MAIYIIVRFWPPPPPHLIVFDEDIGGPGVVRAFGNPAQAARFARYWIKQGFVAQIARV